MISSYLSLSYTDTIDILNKLRQSNLVISYNPITRDLHCIKAIGSFEFILNIPLVQHALNPNLLDGIISGEFNKKANYLILLIRAGYAALGTIEEGVITHHKVIRKYMVRKRQGKAQLTYLALKGKSRGGGRLRLELTQEFYQEIRKKLHEWREIINFSDLIFFQCSPRLWDGLFKIKSKFPIFTSKDRRLRKISITTYKPSFKELRRVNYVLSKGSLLIKSEEKISSKAKLFLVLDSSLFR
ncbi:MAG: hypothetical protein ACFFAU_11445 [Candidatus Hodarchaeota archaeon]